jgi:predicted O-methyltransferase YrrM
MLFGVLETANLLSLKLWVKNRPALHHYPGMVFRDYMSLVETERWSSRSIFDLVPELSDKPRRVTIEHLPGAGVSTSADELVYLALVTQALAPSLIFEIGTFRGRTALNFALNSPHDCKVLTLDLPPDRKNCDTGRMHAADASLAREAIVGVDYRDKDVSHKIQQLYGSSLEFDFTPYRARVDLVFVDGAHDYRTVRSDTENAMHMVRAGGLVLWHDFANYGHYNDVTRAIFDCIESSEIAQIANTQLALYRKPLATRPVGARH